MLLIYPPMAKASEPPAGIAILGGVLKAHNVPYKIVDFNYEGTEFLLNNYFDKYPKKRHNLDLLRSVKGYENTARYTKAVNELNRGLYYNQPEDRVLNLANYSSSKYNQLNSSDLLKAAENYSDNSFFEFYKTRLPELLINNISMIGISLQFINQVLPAFALIGYIKKVYPNIKIILGGGLITSWSKSSGWNDQFDTIVDKIIPGRAEVELLEFLGVTPNQAKLKTIMPDYSFIEEYKYYSPKKIIPINGSLGCGWKRCTFCPEKAENNPYINKKATIVIDEMDYLNRLYSPGLFHFLDNEITPSLLKAIIASDNKVPWYGFTKFYDELLNYNFCRSLKNSGCTMLKLGLESGDQRVLDSMDKGIDLEKVRIILKHLQKSGIKTYIYILFGTPEEDYEAAVRTRNFLVELHESITYLNLAVFNMPLDSDLASSVETEKFSNADLSLYTNFLHPKGWDRKEIRKFLSSEVKSHPYIKAILNRTPTLYNANHGSFF